MARCSTCKKEERANYSLWDRVRLFLFGFFHNDIIDLADDKFTQGFGEGYKIGYQSALEKKTESVEDILKRWPNY